MIWILCVPALVALAMTLLNLRSWPRGSFEALGSGSIERVSVLIPARDEERHIRAAVEAALALGPLEVVVCDDKSTDRTPEILAALQRADRRLHVVRGRTLPPGWVGKPHACHQLAQRAAGDWLVFVDADTVLMPGALAGLLTLAADREADIVTALPHQRMDTAIEQLMMPLLHMTYVSWLPLALVHRSRDPRFVAANGQLLAIRRSALDALGGFAAIRGEVVDDLALCRLAKERGQVVVFADGSTMARTRMYRSASELWSGFSKNIFEGLGEQPALLAGAITLYLWAWVLPWVVLPVGMALGATWTWPALVGTLAAVVQRALLAARFRQPAWSILAHPLAVIGLVCIAINSWRWTRAGTVTWRGRTYGSRSTRGVGDA